MWCTGIDGTPSAQANALANDVPVGGDLEAWTQGYAGHRINSWTFTPALSTPLAHWVDFSVRP